MLRWRALKIQFNNNAYQKCQKQVNVIIILIRRLILLSKLKNDNVDYLMLDVQGQTMRGVSSLLSCRTVCFEPSLKIK